MADEEEDLTMWPGMPAELANERYEKIVRKQQEEAKRVEVITSTIRHDVQRLWMEELNDNQLQALSSIMHSISCGGGKKMALFIEGQIDAARALRFGYCTACDKNHDDSLEEMMNGDGQGTGPVGGDTSAGGEVGTGD